MRFFYRSVLCLLLLFAILRTKAQQISSKGGIDSSQISTNVLATTSESEAKLDSTSFTAGLEWLVPKNASDSVSVHLYQQYLKIHPNNSRAKFMLGITYIHLQNYTSAIDVLAGIISDSLYNTDALLGTAYAYDMLDQSQYTKEYYLRALESVNLHISTDSTIARSYLLRGYINTRLNNYRTVLQDYDRCIALNMTDKDVYFWRGLARIALNQNAIGCDDLYRAVKMGYDERAYNQLCYRCTELCKRYKAENNIPSSSKKDRRK